jgi:hypothetical protein
MYIDKMLYIDIYQHISVASATIIRVSEEYKPYANGCSLMYIVGIIVCVLDNDLGWILRCIEESYALLDRPHSEIFYVQEITIGQPSSQIG